MSDIALINDSQQSAIVTNGIGKNGEIYMKAAGSTDAGALVVYDNGSWRKFADEASSFSNAYSVDFDGTNDYMDVGTISTFNNTPSTFSISIWFYGEIMLGGFSDTGVGFYTWVDGKLYIHAGMVGSLSMVNPFSSSAWNHALLTYNASGSTKFYVNGNTTPSLSATASAITVQAGNTYSIGRYTHYNLVRPGLIDEVAIFSTELSSSDLTTIYNSGVPNDISSLSPVHWWRMGDNDGGTGITITDQGSGGNDGTLTNGPTFSSSVPS